MATNSVVDFGSIAEKIAGMIGSARDAFNRHSRAGLDQFKNLNEAVSREIDAAILKLNGYIVQARAGEKAQLTAWHDLMVGLHQLVITMSDLSESISRKIKGGVLFSEKAVSQTNGMFDTQAGIFRSLFDIAQTDNEFLKKFIGDEGERIQRDCADFATEHETRLIEGLCTPQAAPIFLAILEKFRLLGKQESELSKKLLKK